MRVIRNKKGDGRVMSKRYSAGKNYPMLTRVNINQFIFEFVLIAQKQSKLTRSERRHVVLEVKRGQKLGWIKIDGQDIWNGLASETKPEPMNLEQKTNN